MEDLKLKWQVTSPENRIAGGWLTYTTGVILIILIYRFIITIRKLYFSNSQIAPAQPPLRSNNSVKSSSQSQSQSQLGFVFFLYFIILQLIVCIVILFKQLYKHIEIVRLLDLFSIEELQCVYVEKWFDYGPPLILKQLQCSHLYEFIYCNNNNYFDARLVKHIKFVR